MNITLARIDDRLIHGQVTTVWSKVANAQRIIICNDEVYNDEVRRTLLRQAAPPGMAVPELYTARQTGCGAQIISGSVALLPAQSRGNQQWLALHGSKISRTGASFRRRLSVN